VGCSLYGAANDTSMDRFQQARAVIALAIGGAVLAGAPAAPAAEPSTTRSVAASAPAAFPMAMDSGTRFVRERTQARRDISRAEAELSVATELQQGIQAQVDTLSAEMARLDVEAQAASAQVAAAQLRVAALAATAYKRAGGGQIDATIEAARSAQDVLDLSWSMRIIEGSGDYALDVFLWHDTMLKGIVEHLAAVTQQRADAQDDLEAAIAHEADMRELRDSARARLAAAQDGIASFHRAARTAGSPILGPSLLSAGDLAAFVRARGGTPQLSVSLEALAQIYIEESAAVGVRGDVAWAQSILETGWFEFANSMVDPEDNNFAGVGACDTCKGGFSFPDARSGVRAQMQLLRVYVDDGVGRDSLGKPLLLPGTLRLSFRGDVQSWWDLTGTWATANTYGNRVYDLYNRMVAAS
jgi:Mannosyl-glycoprotein endo-beta-N-acetylglucosaminidase